MYESPIRIIETAVQTIMEQRENTIVAKVQDAIDVQVDKGELLRALQYDRGQYNKGYKDGKAEATPKWIPVTERLPEKKGNYLGFTGSTFMVGYYKGDAVWWILAYDREGVDLFTHWTPLPEPPKGE